MTKTPSRKHRPTAEAAAPLITGRVTAGHGRHYFVTTEDGAVLEAHRRGKKGDVVVGDVVECTEPVSGVSAIESIRERRNLLYRSDEWRIKSLAANIDLVCIVFASRPTFNPWFIWRALLAAHQAGIPALVIRNKAELAEGAEEAAAAVRLLESIGHDVITVSATGEPEATRARLIERLEGRASLLVGQSGMGKSTILNLLVPHAQAATREFSVALNLGKQTTTAARWYDAKYDADHIYKRTPEDKDNRILLFVRRNKEDKGEAKAFYFLGEVEAQGEPVPVTLPATGDRAFEIDYRLDVPVRSDIYAYVTMAED